MGAASAYVFLLMFGAVGCGTPDEDEEAVEEEEEPGEKEKEEAAITIDEWRNPTGVAEIVDSFEKMVWTWASIEDGEDGEVVQAEVERQILPGELVDQALEGVVGAIFWPFWTFEEYGIHDALVESTPGIEWSVISTEKEQFGDSSAEVTRLEVDVGPPFVPEGREGTATWGVGDFGVYQMLVEWGWSEITSEGDSAVEYNLKEVVQQ